MGKTGFMLSVAKNAAQTHKKHVAIFSLEMSNEQLVQRLIAQETGIDSQRLRTGKLTEDEWPLFTHAIEVLADTHIFLDDTPASRRCSCAPSAAACTWNFSLDLVMVDYLQLMSSGVAHRQPRAGSLVHLAQPEGAGARAECAGAGCGAALPRGGTARR